MFWAKFELMRQSAAQGIVSRRLARNSCKSRSILHSSSHSVPTRTTHIFNLYSCTADWHGIVLRQAGMDHHQLRYDWVGICFPDAPAGGSTTSASYMNGLVQPDPQCLPMDQSSIKHLRLLGKYDYHTYFEGSAFPNGSVDCCSSNVVNALVSAAATGFNTSAASAPAAAWTCQSLARAASASPFTGGDATVTAMSGSDEYEYSYSYSYEYSYEYEYCSESD